MALCRRPLGGERHRYANARPDKLGTGPMEVDRSPKAGEIPESKHQPIRFSLSVENEWADAGRGG